MFILDFFKVDAIYMITIVELMMEFLAKILTYLSVK